METSQGKWGSDNPPAVSIVVSPGRPRVYDRSGLLPLLILLSTLVLLHFPFLAARRTQGYKRVRHNLKDELRRAARRALPFSSRPRREEARLDRLPVEILHNISLYACTDGGRTACSLSLVSRYIHAASRGARFNSVSIITGSNWLVRRLLSCFEAACESARKEGAAAPKIRHLLIISHQNFLYDEFKIGVDWERNEHIKTLREHLTPVVYEQHRESLREQYHAALEALLQTVAGDLETLCIFQSFGVEQTKPLHLACSGFPRLRELWCYRGPPQFVFSDDAGRGAERTPAFPVLSRFHMRDPTISPDFPSWMRDAPHLESLRIMPYSFESNAVPPWVESLLSVITDTNWPRGGPVQLFVALPISLANHPENNHNIATAVHQTLQSAAAPIIYVPYYCHQDVDDERAVRVGHMGWESVIMKYDWLARISGSQNAWQDGIYVRDFWTRYQGDNTHIKSLIAQQIERRDLYLPPLRIWPNV